MNQSIAWRHCQPQAGLSGMSSQVPVGGVLADSVRTHARNTSHGCPAPGTITDARRTLS